MNVENAQQAVAIVREFAQRSFGSLYWSEAKEVNFDSENNEWIVIFTASPATLASYCDYEAALDSQSGNIVRFKKLNKK